MDDTVNVPPRVTPIRTTAVLPFTLLPRQMMCGLTHMRGTFTRRTTPCRSRILSSLGWCRNKNIETWDIRRLPTYPAHAVPPAVPTPGPPAPPRLGDLTCAANSPDFWVEPHGLCVAVYGAPRHSQRFGAKHAFWPWPKPAEGSLPEQSSSSSSNSSNSNSSADAGESGIGVTGDQTEISARGKGRGGGQGGGVEGRGGVARGVEVPVPGVVSDSDYRLCVSTGVKFTDTHLATVLDSSRVLVDEMMAAAEPADGVERLRTVVLSS